MGKPRGDGKGWIRKAKDRALDLARFGRLDADIVATLRGEFPPVEERYRAHRYKRCAELVEKLGDQLEDQRAVGQSLILERLHKISSGDTREALTATTWLARELLGHGRTTETRTKNLARYFRDMSPAQLRHELGILQQRLGPRAVHGGEGGEEDEGAQADAE